MNYTKHRISQKEEIRIGGLLDLIPEKGESALDVGARDGYISIKLTDFFEKVTSLDLKEPIIYHDKIQTVKGDITALDFPDQSFDLVFCTEVLEHIPTHLLTKACSELQRLSRKYIIIGVPYKQDIRVGRTTCYRCWGKNPPWGHVNVFDENYLRLLFQNVKMEKISFVGKNNSKTNFISTFLMDLAGNPFGNYSQKELCIHCHQKIKPPYNINLFQVTLAGFSFSLKKIQNLFVSSHPNWIHILFSKTL